jgi:hypothetical protein
MLCLAGCFGRAGRAIKAKLEPDQLKMVKELKGIPLVDK